MNVKNALEKVSRATKKQNFGALKKMNKPRGRCSRAPTKNIGLNAKRNINSLRLSATSLVVLGVPNVKTKQRPNFSLSLKKISKTRFTNSEFHGVRTQKQTNFSLSTFAYQRPSLSSTERSIIAKSQIGRLRNSFKNLTDSRRNAPTKMAILF